MWNFEALTIQFQTGNNMVLLKGLQGGTAAMATKKQLSKMNSTSGTSCYSFVITKQPSLQVEDKILNKDLDAIAQWELKSLLN